MAMSLAVLVAQASAATSWERATEVGLPPGAAPPTSQYASLNTVACTSVGNCTAIGGYDDTSANQHPMQIVETNGTWGAAKELSFPSLASFGIAAITCPSTAWCVAVGSYGNSGGGTDPAADVESNGIWGAPTKISLPSHAATGATALSSLGAVSCIGVGSCMAVGSYSNSSSTDTNGYNEPLAVTYSGGKWNAGYQPQLPSGAVPPPYNDAYLNDIGCPPGAASLNDCVMAGGYQTAGVEDSNTEVIDAYVQTEAYTDEILPPANPAQAGNYQRAPLTGVSCPASGQCMAVGSYENAGDVWEPMEAEQTSSGWPSTATPVLEPSNSDPTGLQPSDQMDSLSCPAVGTCFSGGTYAVSAGPANQDNVAKVTSATGGVWNSATEISLPGDAYSDPFAEMYSVSCPSTTACVGVGRYGVNSNNNGEAMVDSTAPVVTPPPPPRRITAPVLTSVKQSAKKWREGNKLAQISRHKKGAPVGTTFSFTLSEASRVKFAFTQTAKGRKVKHKCVAKTHKNRKKARCTRTLTRGTLSFSATAGVVKLKFFGRISRHKKLRAGSYTLLITATDSGQTSTTHRLKFTIVK
jgi:hypothetical protein